MGKTKTQVKGTTAMDEAPAAEQTPPKALEPHELVQQRFPERISYKLKIIPLWTAKDGTAYYRVNYSHLDELTKIESYWVKVYNGSVDAEKEIEPKKFN